MSNKKNHRRKRGRTKTQPYRKSQAFDASCRPHGGCAYCREGRRHRDRRQIQNIEE